MIGLRPPWWVSEARNWVLERNDEVSLKWMRAGRWRVAITHVEIPHIWESTRLGTGQFGIGICEPTRDRQMRVRRSYGCPGEGGSKVAEDMPWLNKGTRQTGMTRKGLEKKNHPARMQGEWQGLLWRGSSIHCYERSG